MLIIICESLHIFFHNIAYFVKKYYIFFYKNIINYFLSSLNSFSISGMPQIFHNRHIAIKFVTVN